MGIGVEISGFVRKLTDAKSLSHQELLDAVQETLDWLRASPDYRNYIKVDAFSLLPNEIIHDVVNSHGVQKRNTFYKLENLAKIKGFWGEFARELNACTTQENGVLDRVTFRSRAYNPTAGSVKEEKISFKEARNQFICSSSINGDFDLEQLTAVAPKLCDDIHFNELPDTHCKALDLMGTRFTKIAWKRGDPKKAATPDLVHFLRRQLQSNYLRKLGVSGVKFEEGAFDKELVGFVTRPWFEMLYLIGASFSLPFKVIEGAHKAWQARNVLKLEERIIFAYFSKETLGKIEEYFETKFDFANAANTCELTIHDPEESNAKFCLRVQEVNDEYWMRMIICDL